jgi:hypothetical protein
MWQLLAWQTQVLIITGLAIVFALAATLFWPYTKYGMMPQEVLFRGVAVAFAVWSRANHGPGWAFVNAAYVDLDLIEAILPLGYPREFATEYESSLPPNVLQRAAAWGLLC